MRVRARFTFRAKESRRSRGEWAAAFDFRWHVPSISAAPYDAHPVAARIADVSISVNKRELQVVKPGSQAPRAEAPAEPVPVGAGLNRDSSGGDGDLPADRAAGLVALEAPARPAFAIAHAAGDVSDQLHAHDRRFT